MHSFCTCLPGSPHHRHHPCDVFLRRFVPSSIGEGGIAMAQFQRVDSQGEPERKIVVLPVLGHRGTLYIDARVQREASPSVLACLQDYVLQEIAHVCLP